MRKICLKIVSFKRHLYELGRAPPPPSFTEVIFCKTTQDLIQANASLETPIVFQNVNRKMKYLDGHHIFGKVF